MANEITLQLAMNRVDSVVPNNRHSIPQTTVRLDQSQKTHCDVQASVGTSEETITFTDVTTNGYLFIQNMDGTNYVEVGTTTTDYPMKIKAGMFALFPLNAGKTVYAKANTAACVVRFCQYPA